VGRTLLSDAVDCDFDFDFDDVLKLILSSKMARTRIKIKSVGQECPAHTRPNCSIAK